MKIFTIAATPFFSDRGCHIRMYNEAKYLQKFGAEVVVCTYHIGKDIADIKIKRIGKSDWYKKLSPGFAWGKVWLDLKLFFLCVKEIKNFKPDIIHAHLYEGLAIGALAKMACRSKASVIFDLQGDLEQEMENYSARHLAAKKIFLWISRWIVHWADMVVVSSDRVSTDNFAGKRVITVSDGVDLELYAAASPKISTDMSELVKWKGGSKILIYAGSIEKSKGVDGLVKEFVKISDGIPDWKLLLVGHGQDLMEYRHLVEKENKADCIRLLGAVDYFELPNYLALADAAIDPKTGSSEGSGKLVNYMAGGLPVICYDNRFNREFLGDKGFYINSMQDLGARLSQLNDFQRISYNLSMIDEKVYAGKLYEAIMNLAGHDQSQFSS